MEVGVGGVVGLVVGAERGERQVEKEDLVVELAELAELEAVKMVAEDLVEACELEANAK